MSKNVSVSTKVHADDPKSHHKGKPHDFYSLVCDDETVDLTSLRAACASGVPEDGGLRAVVWKLLLQLLPADRKKWKETLEAKRKQYKSFCEVKHFGHHGLGSRGTIVCLRQEFIVDPKEAENECQLNPLSMRKSSSDGPKTQRELEKTRSEACDISGYDHPLALDTRSKWFVYFQDTEIRDQIDRDVMRTHPDIPFFSENSTSARTHREFTSNDMLQEIKRALFVFTKLNPGITYVQGMNEIYAPLYFIFKTCEHGEFGELKGFGSTEHAEADAFFCFLDLMGDFRDNFCKQLDNSTTGIRAVIRKFSDRLAKEDPAVSDHLTHKTQVDHHYFAFRWITLLLTQEFEFLDVLRMWDTLIAAKPLTRQGFLLSVCIAMIVSVRDEILQGDYTQNLKLLQKFPVRDVNELIRDAIRIDKRISRP